MLDVCLDSPYEYVCNKWAANSGRSTSAAIADADHCCSTLYTFPLYVSASPAGALRTASSCMPCYAAMSPWYMGMQQTPSCSRCWHRQQPISGSNSSNRQLARLQQWLLLQQLLPALQQKNRQSLPQAVTHSNAVG